MFVVLDRLQQDNDGLGGLYRSTVSNAPMHMIALLVLHADMGLLCANIRETTKDGTRIQGCCEHRIRRREKTSDTGLLNHKVSIALVPTKRVPRGEDSSRSRRLQSAETVATL